jgi:hypothetical protein
MRASPSRSTASADADSRYPACPSALAASSTPRFLSRETDERVAAASTSRSSMRVIRERTDSQFASSRAYSPNSDRIRWRGE